MYDVRNSIGNERKNRSPFHLKLIFLIPNPHNVMFVQTARHFIHNYVVTQIQCLLIEIFIKCTKDVKELGWMSHRVIRFWFLSNFLFISAFFDILASLSIFRIFSRGFSGRPKSSCLDIPRTIIKCDCIN